MLLNYIPAFFSLNRGALLYDDGLARLFRYLLHFDATNWLSGLAHDLRAFAARLFRHYLALLLGNLTALRPTLCGQKVPR